MADWFLVVQGEKHGPFRPDQVRQKLELGEIRPETMVWRDGMPSWAPLQSTELYPQPVRARSDQANAAAASTTVFLPSDVYGGFWIRVGAALIDGIILWIPNMLLALMIPAIIPGERAMVEGLLTGLAQIVLYFFYYVQLQGRMEGTPGKRALGLRLVSENFRALDTQQLSVRFVMSIFSGLIFCLGYLTVALDPRKQSWHDKAAKTLVVRQKHLNQARLNAGA